MAREEEDREDLLREATALVRRVELEVDGLAESIVAGFRSDGAASFYFGQQVVYQFNTAGELRRGYVDGRLLKADRGRLAQLVRQRQGDVVNLIRHDLTGEETRQFLVDARERLQRLQTALVEGNFRIVGQVPPEADLASDVQQWLEKLPAQIAIARTPGVR